MHRDWMLDLKNSKIEIRKRNFDVGCGLVRTPTTDKKKFENEIWMLNNKCWMSSLVVELVETNIERRKFVGCGLVKTTTMDRLWNYILNLNEIAFPPCVTGCASQWRLLVLGLWQLTNIISSFILQPINKSINQQINKSTNQQINKSTNQQINKSTIRAPQTSAHTSIRIGIAKGTARLCVFWCIQCKQKWIGVGV